MNRLGKILKNFTPDSIKSEEILRLGRLYAFLSRTNNAIIRINVRDQLLKEICSASVEEGGFFYSRLTLFNGTVEPEFVIDCGHTPSKELRKLREDTFSALISKVMESGEPLVANSSEMIGKINLKSSRQQGACKSMAGFPIKGHGHTIGVFSLSSKESGYFGDTEIELISQVTDNIVYALHTLTNQEKREYAEKLLLESQERYADLYENSPDMFFSVDATTGRFINCNETLCKATGYTKSELIGKPLSEMYHPDSMERFHENLEKYRKTGEIRNSELKIIVKDGTTRTVLLNSSAIRDEDGKIIRSRSVWRDITESKRRERIEKRLWHILKESLNEIYIFDGTTFKFEFANDGALQNLGYTSEEILKMTPIDIKPEISEELFAQIVEPLRSGQKSRIVFETKHRRKDGTDYDVEVHLQYLSHSGDNVFLALILDITGDKRREKIDRMRYNVARAVATSESTADLLTTIHQELSKTVDADNFYIALYDEKTGLLRALIETDEADSLGSWPAARSLSGYVLKKQRPVHLRRNDIRQLVEDDVIDIIGTPAESWLGVPLTIEGKTGGILVVQSYDNQNAYDESSIATLEIMANEFSLYLEKKEAEVVAKKLSTAIAQSPIIVTITDLNGKIEYVNPEFTYVTGYTSEEVIGEKTSILKSGNKSREEYKLLWDTILAGEDWHGEFLNKKKNGELYWEEAVISPVKDSKGVITNFVAIKEDITEKRRMVEELVQAKDDAEEMNRLKTNFLANMSHELRTPLNGILGFSEIVAEESTEPSIRDMGGMINKSGKRLLETLNLILDLSRIEAGRLEIKSEEVDISLLATEVINIYSLKAREKGLYLNLVAQPGIGQFKSDRRLLTGILKNLIDNAVKFTRSGGVVLEVTATGSELEIIVTDTGIGIPHEGESVIWEEFRQASEGLSRNFEGVGLGLSLTKNFIQKLGGSITFSSKPGEGTSFKVKLPVDFIVGNDTHHTHRGSIRSESEGPVTPSKKPSILIVEDDLNSIKYISFLIAGSYEIETRMDGTSALEAIQRRKFDVILMDINLGKGMNGIEVTKKIRELPGYRDTPVVAITAFAMAGDREEFLGAGCSHYLAKPFSKKEFLGLLESTRLI